MIERPIYLEKLIERRDNGLVKVITGLRRCGKTYLLEVIYKEWLIQQGVPEDNILFIALDKDSNARYRNPLILSEFIRDKIDSNDSRMYVMIDEIQKCVEIDNPYIPEDSRTSDNRIGFYDVALGLKDDCDLYITGSNSHLLSSDIITMFRGKGDLVRVYPLSFAEFHSASKGDLREDWSEYLYHGGMPLVLSYKSQQSKDSYLKDLVTEVYIKDIQERFNIRDVDDLSTVMDIIASNIGSYTNAGKIADTFSKGGISRNTVQEYIGHFMDCFLIGEVKRFDVRGRRYVEGQRKYYYSDIGLRNARLNFREMSRAKLIENAVYNELIIRGYDVDVGRIDVRRKDADGRSVNVTLEMDFIINKGFERAYIQVAMGVDDEGKMEQETASLKRLKDGFAKILLIDSEVNQYVTEDGIRVISILEFMTDPDVLRF